MKPDYQKQTDEAISRLGEERPRLLLQCCCGPCGSYVLEYLSRHFQVTALFYNPNIFPAAEYEKRLENLEAVIKRYGGAVLRQGAPYEPERFDKTVLGLEDQPEGGLRCTRCFGLRLEETARLAKEGGFDYFCSTLTVSPHKDAKRINEIGLDLQRRYGVEWLPSDFKKRGGYKRSIALSREYGLYRQEYCGCRYSLNELERRRKNDEQTQQHNL